VTYKTVLFVAFVIFGFMVDVAIQRVVLCKRASEILFRYLDLTLFHLRKRIFCKDKFIQTNESI